MTIARVVAAIIAIVLLAACGAIGADDPAGTTPLPTSTVEEPRATLPEMKIVTRTPVDPNRLPTPVTGEPGEVERPPTYIVQDGDSLYSIAVKFQLELAEIVELNDLADPNDITVGQELLLPVPESE